MEPAAPYWELGWPLAKRASSRSGLAPCAWPVLAEAGLLAYSVIFSEHFKHPNYEVLYYNKSMPIDKGQLLRFNLQMEEQ